VVLTKANKMRVLLMATKLCLCVILEEFSNMKRNKILHPYFYLRVKSRVFYPQEEISSNIFLGIVDLKCFR
jgi:hypothetical protein